MTRRMMLMVLALVGVMVLVVTVSPPERAAQRRARAPRRRRRGRRLSDPDAFDVSRTLSAAAGEQPQTVEAELGDRVEIIVEGA